MKAKIHTGGCQLTGPHQPLLIFFLMAGVGDDNDREIDCSKKWGRGHRKDDIF